MSESEPSEGTRRPDWERDVFLSHAGKDKATFVEPIVSLLHEREISYWLDEAELIWGHSLLDQISNGLEKSRYVLVFISEAFLAKRWPEAELKAALNKEIATGIVRVLPVFICDPELILAKHPFLRDKRWLTWTGSAAEVVTSLELVLGRSFRSGWVFSHPSAFRGVVWVKVMPKLESIGQVHRFTIRWGRWEYEGRVLPTSGDPIILNFRKIAEPASYPIEFSIEPAAFCSAGKGNPVLDVNKGWRLIDKKGLVRAMLSRQLQSLLPDSDRESEQSGT